MPTCPTLLRVCPNLLQANEPRSSVQTENEAKKKLASCLQAKMPERATENVPLQKFNGRLVSPPDITPPPAYEPCPSLQPTRGAEERASVELYTRYKCRSSPNMPILERTTLRRKRTDKTSEVQDSDADENDSDHEDEQPVRTKPRTLLSTRCTVAREVTKPRTALTAKRTPLPRLTKIKKGDINNTITEGTEPDEEEVEAAGIEGSDTEKDSPEDERRIQEQIQRIKARQTVRAARLLAREQ